MLDRIRHKVIEDEIPYTGAELRPHWCLEKTGIYGSVIVAWAGPCSVKTSEMVDMEDRLAGDRIAAEEMLHFMAEFYGTNLEAAVLYQRLFIQWAERLLRDAGMEGVRRFGDDLMVGDRKLSVSIATVSPVSVLIHWGFNIDAAGAPVRTAELRDLKWDRVKALSFAKELLGHYIGEVEEIQIAQCKVRPV